MELNKLNFYCIVDGNLCDISAFQRYEIKRSLRAGLILIKFDEKEIDIIRKLFKDNVYAENNSLLDFIQLFGSDGNIYIMSRTSVDKKDKMSCSVVRSYRRYLWFKKKQNKADKYIKNNLDKYNDGIINVCNHKFKACKYIDKNNDMCFPFRLYKSKAVNKPLFVLFHGAGALGNDNIRQHIENKRFYKHLLNFDCNILAPQAPFGSNMGDNIQNYVKSVKNLLDELSFDFDRTRIYIIGSSFGGFCVWHIAYLFPDFFAAGVPVMGGLCYDKNNFGSYDINRLTTTPLWVAHSSDDTTVLIDSDDFCVSELKKLGADVKYSRWTGYGHAMSNQFFETEKWAEWCLSKQSVK